MSGTRTRHTVLSAGLVALLVAGCGGGDHATSAATSTDAPSQRAGVTYFGQYGVATPAYRPRRLEPSVDGSLYVRPVHWQVWTDRRAVGQGVAHVNDCRPSCAEGSFTTHRVTVYLTQPRERCGRRFFLGFRLSGSDYRTHASWKGLGCG